MKKILSILGLMFLVACGGAEAQIRKDSLAKLKTFENGMIEITAKETAGRDVKLTVLEHEFFDDYHLAVVHFLLVEKPSEMNPEPVTGHLFFILGRMKPGAEWMPMTNFSRIEPPVAPKEGEGEKL